MMRWHLVFVLFKKELTETLRDRRTLILALVVPLLLYPLLAISLTKVQEAQAVAQEARASKIAVWGDPSLALSKILTQSNLFELRSWHGLSPQLKSDFLEGRIPPPMPPKPGDIKDDEGRKGRANGKSKTDPIVASPHARDGTNATPASTAPHLDHPPEALSPDSEPDWVRRARDLVSAKDVDAVLVVWQGFDKALGTGGLARVSILSDSVSSESSKASDRLEKAVDSFRRSELADREKRFGMPEGFTRAVWRDSRNLALPQRQAGSVLGAMLPFLLMILSASGGLYAAIDLTAGEKERNTLQTLLCAPLTSLEIIAGKFLAGWVIVILTTLANLVSIGATLGRIMASVGAIQLSPSMYLLAFLVLLPATFAMTAIFLAVAVFARDFKDGQNLLTPMLMVIALPLGATTLPGVELNAWTAFVPLVNVALLIKSVFLGEVRGDLVFLSLVSSVIYAGLTLQLAARVFRQEQVLLGGRDSWRSVFSLKPERTPVPSPSLALATFAAVFVTIFYLGQYLQGANTVVMLLVTQIGFFLLPNILVGWRWGLSPRDTYLLRKPPILALVGALCIGFSAWAVAAGLVTRVFPPPKDFVKSLEDVLLFNDRSVPIWCVWLLVGVLPGICEELFFRGLVMSSLRKMGMWPALIGSSLLFAVAHSSIYRLLPTLFLGLVLGYVAWRSRSIWVSMTAHAINNSLLMTFLYYPELGDRLGFKDVEVAPWSITLLGLALMVVGIVLVRTSTPREVSGSVMKP